MYWLINEDKDEVSYQISKAGLDFSKPISMSVPWFYNNVKNKTDWKVGDGAGFLFTPATETEIRSNLSNLTEGKYLGVNGLENTVYAGRDLFFNAKFDGKGKTSGPTNRFEIRTTDASAILENTIEKQPPWAEAFAYGKWKDKGGIISDKSAWYFETMSMTWVPLVDNGDGTYTGDLIMNVRPNEGYTGDDTTITRRITLQKNMNFGALAVTGSNAGVIQEGQATEQSSFSATRATENVRVNFVNSKTGQLIALAPSATILANLGDTIGVAESGANESDTYTYTAPVIDGYEFSSANSVTVENFLNGSMSPNVLNIQYTPEQTSANFKWEYVGAGTAPELPETIVQIGDVGGVIVAPELPTLPYGYEIKEVVAPDGEVYPDLTTALATGDNGIYPLTGSVNFTIRVKLTAPLVPSLDSVPDFEANSAPIQSGLGVYPLAVSENGKLQVTDDRVNHKGWQLTAAMTQQFTSDPSISEDESPIGVYLKGAFLSFKPKAPVTTSGNTVVAPETSDFKITGDGSQALVMTASADEGDGQWELPFDEIALQTLNSDIKTDVAYSAKLMWTLSDVP